MFGECTQCARLVPGHDRCITGNIAEHDGRQRAGRIIGIVSGEIGNDLPFP